MNPETKVGIFREIIGTIPLVAWQIWIGGLLFLFGSVAAIAPSIKELMESSRDPDFGAQRGDPPVPGQLAFCGVLVLSLALGGVACFWPLPRTRVR